MRLCEIIDQKHLTPNPFPLSKIQSRLYHGTPHNFEKFERFVHGIFAASHRDYAQNYDSENILAFYANSKQLITLNYKDPEDDAIIELLYDRDYSAVADVISEWVSRGYDACYYGGEGESYILFGDIELVNAKTGKHM